MNDKKDIVEALSKFREELRTCNSTTYVSASRKLMRMDLIDKTIALINDMDITIRALMGEFGDSCDVDSHCRGDEDA